jgi:CheY-like chemotaxis protein
MRTLRPDQVPPAEARRTPAPPVIALVVDDHDLVRASMAEMVEALGYRVIEAASGEAAARILDGRHEVGLLVTDQIMPGMSGTDLARIARSAHPGLPVILVSGGPEPDGLPPGLLCLAKPFRRAQLQACLASVNMSGIEEPAQAADGPPAGPSPAEPGPPRPVAG